MGNFYSGLIAAAFVGLAGTADAGCAANTLEMRGPSGIQRFGIEIADTEATRERGLMQRASMPSAAGMLFVYQRPTHAYFWMKDTLIPLDMIFADATGQVTRLQTNAIPQDLTPIDGGDGVSYVLEINAGLAKGLGIVEGSQMRSAAIEQSSAIWPCSGE
ncbi:MAG: DUF192 domain-containing protein [Cypionkella sp.]